MSLLTGCSTTGAVFKDPAVLVRDPGRLVGKPKLEKNVVRIVTLWEAAHGKDPADKPCRGFAGQILFFGPHGETGARVRGKVVIYEYDQYEPDAEEDLVPLHSFTFEQEAWDVHRTEGTLGHSYCCFIPYMNKHRDQVQCGLKVEFIAEDGRKISSDVVEVLLPSRSATNRAAAMTRGFVRESQLGLKPQQAGQPNPIAPLPHATVVSPEKSAAPAIESISIPMPKGQMTQRSL